ncbi:TP53-target gene 5 protein [Lagopus leucura]|uniref:TP53-target gene 5 protein n=1 Tax=Lagopus leucura TaxID=30410 RepID=UPI001C67F989|nr:TP53-target gene 5 protein [Lagopus leucura]
MLEPGGVSAAAGVTSCRTQNSAPAKNPQGTQHQSVVVIRGKCNVTCSSCCSRSGFSLLLQVCNKQEAGDPRDKPCSLCTVEQKSRLWKTLKSLKLLRLLKSTNRRVQRLHTVAVHCWRLLTAQGLPGITSLLPRECRHLPELEEAVDNAETSSTSSNADAPMDSETSTPPTAVEAKRDLLRTLPQRFHMPAPKVLCRPSAQRWVKPCCTRSCGESLERTLTIHYSRVSGHAAGIGHRLHQRVPKGL